MYLRANKKTRSEVSLHEPIGADREGNEITLMDVLQDEGEPVAELVSHRYQARRVRDLVRRLSRRERRVIEMRFGLSAGERMTQREVAKALGISRSYVSRIEKKAVRRLGREMKSE